MTQDQNKKQIVEDQSSVELRSFRKLSILSILLFFATLLTISAIWYMNFSEVKKTTDLAQNKEDVDGKVLGASSADPEYLVNLVQSLKEAGFVLYGSDNNIKTIKQKEIFGQAVSGIDFVECDPQLKSANPSECAARGISIYPTWVSGDKKFENYRSLSEVEIMLLESSK